MILTKMEMEWRMDLISADTPEGEEVDDEDVELTHNN